MFHSYYFYLIKIFLVIIKKIELKIILNIIMWKCKYGMFCKNKSIQTLKIYISIILFLLYICNIMWEKLLKAWSRKENSVCIAVTKHVQFYYFMCTLVQQCYFNNVQLHYSTQSIRSSLTELNCLLHVTDAI